MGIVVPPLSKDLFESKATARRALRELTRILCQMIRDDYGYVDEEVQAHMRNVVLFSRAPGAGIVLFKTYSEYLMPHKSEVFAKNISFFRALDPGQYADTVDGDHEYALEMFDAFAKCYDQMTPPDRAALWQVLENVVIICDTMGNL